MRKNFYKKLSGTLNSVGEAFVINSMLEKGNTKEDIVKILFELIE